MACRRSARACCRSDGAYRPGFEALRERSRARSRPRSQGRREQLTKIGLELLPLPPRSPEPNDIELVRRQATYQDYPQRDRTSTDVIGKAVDQAVDHQRDRIRRSATNLIRAGQSRLGQIGPSSVQTTPLLRHRQKGWPTGSV
ncbi:hypothetical protein GCM10023335_81420 [Streptomyces siamensis]|uniref:Transposase n=1 Tax=Streptomyces siamensis TaxID=1274986 RepID=A0ABP9JLR7_9ACTN